MHDLFRMDLYRMRKSRGFRALLIISFALAFVMPLIRRGFIWLVEITGDDPTPIDMLFGANPKLSWIIGNPFSSINALLMFLSAFVFFGADTSRGYIKNTIGLVPGRDRVIITRFLVIMVHNTLFMIAGVIGCLFGTMIFKQIIFDGEILNGILVFLTKYILGLALTALIMWLTLARRSKGLGIVTAVLTGSRMLMAIYMLISMGINLLAKTSDFALGDWIPDQLLYSDNPQQPYTILIAVGMLGLFLWLSILSFRKRDL